MYGKPVVSCELLNAKWEMLNETCDMLNANC